MKTKQDAEQRLAKLPLQSPVEVVDFSEDGRPRRRFRFDNPNGLGVVTIEIDADPSDQQIDDMVRNLPLPPSARAAARVELLAK